MGVTDREEISSYSGKKLITTVESFTPEAPAIWMSRQPTFVTVWSRRLARTGRALVQRLEEVVVGGTELVHRLIAAERLRKLVLETRRRSLADFFACRQRRKTFSYRRWRWGQIKAYLHIQFQMPILHFALGFNSYFPFYKNAPTNAKSDSCVNEP